MDPPAFQKARIKSREMALKRKIEEKIAAIHYKDKIEKIPWEKFKDNLNIPEYLLAKQVKGVEKELRQARERYEEDSYSQSEPLSYITEDLFEEIDSEEDEELNQEEKD